MSNPLAGFDPTLPLEQAKTIPAHWYFCPDVAKVELERIFAKTWQCVGRSELVQAKGQFFSAEIAGESIIVVRGDDGILRGFYNVCRHRAAPLLTEPCGQISKLRCRYHGWTYDLAGRLKGTPEFDGVCNFAHEDNGLVPVGGIEESGMYIWVCLEKPLSPLQDALSPLPAWAESVSPYKSLQFYQRKSYEMACNWKVYVDNYLDGGYHVNTVHPALAGVLDYREYKTTTHGLTVLQSSPMKPSDGDAGRTRTGTEAAYWWVYPNVMFNFYSGIMDVNIVQPLSPERCMVHFDFFFAHGTASEFCKESAEVANQVQIEDGEICEQVQRNLKSRSYNTGRFSVKRENGGYHFHQLLGRALNGEPQRKSL